MKGTDTFARCILTLTISSLTTLQRLNLIICAELPPCQYRVENATKIIRPFYIVNNTTPIQTEYLIMYLHSDKPEQFCSVDVMPLISEHRRRDDRGLLPVYLLFIFRCFRQQNVVFSNLSLAKLYLKKQPVIGHLSILSCGIAGHNVWDLMSVTFTNFCLFHQSYLQRKLHASDRKQL